MIIRNFIATQLAESAEADVEEDEDAKCAPWDPVDTSWVSLSEIKDIIDRNVTLQFESTSRNPAGKRDALEQRLVQHHTQNHGLWAPHAPELSGLSVLI